MSLRKRGEAHKERNGTVEHTNGGIQKTGKHHDAKTDLYRWRLKSDRGRQTWHYLESDEEIKQWPMTTADKYFLGLETASNPLKIDCELTTVSNVLTCLQGSSKLIESKDAT